MYNNILYIQHVYVILFDFVFLSCSRVQSFHIWQTRLETLDIIAQLGLSNAPCTEVKWWCQPGQVHLFTLLLNQFTWKLDKKLRLDVPHDRSSLAWGFNFKSLAMHAMELLDVLTVDTPYPGQERICLSFEESPDSWHTVLQLPDGVSVKVKVE